MSAGNGLKQATRRVQSSVRSAQSKTSLYDFLRHDAYDGGLPFWWTTFVKATEPDHIANTGTSALKNDKMSRRIQSGHGQLDFLYPTETLRWLGKRAGSFGRRSSARPTEHRTVRHFSSIQNNRRAAASYNLSANYAGNFVESPPNHGATSYATPPIDGPVRPLDRGASAYQHDVGGSPGTALQTRPSPQELLKYMRGTLPASQDGKVFEVAWDLYNEVDKDALSDRDITRLVDFLSFSERGEETIRLTFLLRRYFDEEAPRSRMLLSLQEGKLMEAASIFKKELSTTNHVYDSGVSVLVAHAIRQDNWEVALETGASFMQLRLASSSTTPKIRGGDSLLMYPRLSENYLQDVVGGVQSWVAMSKTLNPEQKSFLQLMTCDAITPSNNNTVDANIAVDLLDMLIQLEATSREFFQAVMASNLDFLTKNRSQTAGYKGRRRIIFEAYQRMQRAGLILDQTYLSKLLSVLAQPTDAPLEIEPHVLLDQYRSAYGALDAHAANAMFKLHSRNQSVEQGKRLAANLSTAGEKTSSSVWQMLQLHYRRGQWDDVVKEFLDAPRSAKVKADIMCWNTYLNALCRLGRHADFTQAIQEMRQHGVKPDQSSYMAQLGLYSYQGQTEKVLEVLGVMKEEDIILSSTVLSHLVISYAYSGRMQAAEEAAQLITDTPDAYKSRDELTQPWNHVLRGYSTKADVEACQRVFAEMKKLEIPPDDRSFAALIEVLRRVNESETALRVMQEVMPANGIPALQHHYASVMKGFLAERKYTRVLDLSQRMHQGQPIEPAYDIWDVYLRALAHLDVRSSKSGYRDQVLDRISQLSQQDQNTLTPLDMDLDRTVRHYKNPFEKIMSDVIKIYAQAEQYDMVTELTSRVEITGLVAPEDGVPNESLDLLQSLMTAAQAAERYWDVERYWDLCVAKVNSILQTHQDTVAQEQQQATQDASSWLEPGEILSSSEVFSHDQIDANDASQISPSTDDKATQQHARTERQRTSVLKQKRPMRKRLNLPITLPRNRNHKKKQPFLLARPFITLTESLVARNDMRTFKYMLNGLLEANFKLNNPAWNLTIQTLSAGMQASEILDAFRYCEEYLMPDFPGWRPAAITRKVSFRPLEQTSAKNEGNDYQYLNLPPIGRGPLGARGEQVLLPYTDTLLALRKVFLKRLGGYEQGHAKRPSARGQETPNIVLGTYTEEDYDGKTRARLSTQALEAIAPRTVEALRSMPEVNVRSVKTPRQMW